MGFDDGKIIGKENEFSACKSGPENYCAKAEADFIMT
jgi:hypothetical protein